MICMNNVMKLIWQQNAQTSQWEAHATTIRSIDIHVSFDATFKKNDWKFRELEYSECVPVRNKLFQNEFKENNENRTWTMQHMLMSLHSHARMHARTHAHTHAGTHTQHSTAQVV